MSTWRFRAALAAGLSITLIGCEDGQGGNPFGGASAGGDAKNIALPQARMAGGALTLVPPEGFCIDKRSLKRRFALMARCDTLGNPSASAGAPMGILTVSISDASAAQPLPTPDQTAAAARLEKVSAQKSEVDAVTFRAEGIPPLKELDTVQWRGIARVQDQVIGIAFYGPKGGRAISREGREIVNGLIRKTKAAS
ncbi:hypothetical protein [Sulfitobacter aestuariivivens]|uniref:Uncharacterized protein n=1 Tax=Sulfitobacter aestuariivivens TaxID=2766981 RepID=A0A927HGL8_9RHOB|nr:hypothetical protein [Sulfitobacter aestuariivivens]MBD3665604.1 hypothetical protein [Sulfitobacter aestuariivivens]